MSLVPLVLSFMLTFAAGSKIMFEADPAAIQDSLTQELVMKCALNDTASLFTGGVIGKRDVTETASNVQHVTSIIVMRNSGEHVASVTNYDSAKPLVDLNNLNVTGDVSGSVGERGFLELTWEFPTSAQSGEYVCEINAIDDAGHNVVFTSTLEIGVTQPSITELTKRIDELRADRGNTEHRINQLKTNLTNLATETSRCLQSEHFESGTIMCGHTNTFTWDSDHYGKSKIITTRFTNRYSTPPLVKLGLNFLDDENHRNTRFEVTVIRVTRSNFKLKCHTWDDTKTYDLGVNWMSFPLN